MAVLPTPASPMRTGLFFVRRESTSMVCSISSSRPTTGSISPLRAMAVRSRPYASSVGVSLTCSCCWGSWRVGRGELSGPEIARCMASGVTPASDSISPARESGFATNASRMCSGPM